jgi:hypothetical protein
MTITIKPLTAVLVIALFGVLAGLALGRVTQAGAGGRDPSVTLLRSIDNKLGANYSYGTVLGELSKIKSNSWGVCRAVEGSGCQLARPNTEP